MARTKREVGFREKILRKATRLIREQGVSNTSLADIAHALSISPGTLFYYFPSKGDLIFEISRRHIKRMSGKILRWISLIASVKNPISILEAVMKLFLDTRREAGEIHLFLMHEALTGNDTLRARFRDAYREWSVQMGNGVQRVLGPGSENELLGKMIIALLDGFLMQLLLGMEIPPYRAVSNFLLKYEHSPV